MTEFKEKEYTDCYQMLDDIISTLRKFGGVVDIKHYNDIEIDFYHSGLVKMWKIRMENISKESAFFKFLVSERHIKAMLDTLNYQSKDIIKPTIEELIKKYST